jgi:transposase
MMPVHPTAALMGDVFCVSMAEATVLATGKEARNRLQPTGDSISATPQVVGIVHADETGLRVAGSLHWMRVLVIAMLSWGGCLAKRGREAFDAFAILPNFLGMLINV